MVRLPEKTMEEQWQPARASWEERFQAQNEEFIKANLWQREAMEIRVNSQDGFLVLIGLFVVLVLENLWSLDPDEFASKEKLEVFLILLVCAAAGGVFAIFSMTMIRLKLQRLMVRDIAALKQVTGPASYSHLDRLLDGWNVSSAQRRQCPPACISYEWYHGGGINNGRCAIIRSKRWNPSCPRSLVRYATLSFAITVVCSMAALAVRLADTKGVMWSVLGSAILAVGIVLPMVFIRAGTSAPDGLKPSQESPFHGF